MWTEADDEELEYDAWYEYDATVQRSEDEKIRPAETNPSVWPHWSEGVPTTLRRKVGSPPFDLGNACHRYREYFVTVEYQWNPSRTLVFLSRNYGWLPRTSKSEWSGVYRVFCPDTVIDRSCGKDPTGTLYLGMAGAGGRNWSIMRTRIMALVKGEHHVANNLYNDAVRARFPWDSLRVQWAFTGTRQDYQGKEIPEALLAETWLLRCYNESFGEYPPWNQRG